jgi:hypothetical protein
MAQKIIKLEYENIQRAFDFFNARLFAGQLSIPMFTFQRGRTYRGFFHADRYNARGRDGTEHEIALNPDCFPDRTDQEILSTLLHEQVHLWQEEFGKPSRAGYHNKQWARKMIEVGLRPTGTGKPGGKQTGQSVTHIIVPEGPYAKAYQGLVKAFPGFKLGWESSREERKANDRGRSKFTCPSCHDNAWAKSSVELDCRKCGGIPLVLVTRKPVARAPVVPRLSPSSKLRPGPKLA